MKCSGCGVELQFEDPKKPGFIPREVYERRLAEGDEILCQRCFRIKHYGRFEEVELWTDFVRELKNVLGSFDLILWVIDITDFEGTYRKEIANLLKGKKIIYAVNKIDLLPKAVSRKEMKEWLKRRIRTKYPEDIRLVSSLKKFGLNSLKKHLLSFGYDKALVIGVANVGKSSLVSELSEHSTTVSPFPGTTLGLLRRKMKGARFYLYDTPGIATSDRAVDLLSVECQRKIVPSRELTRKTFKISRGRSVLIGGMFKLDVLNDDRPIFQIFTYENVKLHETRSERAKELFETRKGDLLVPPCDKEELSNVEWIDEIFKIDVEEELVATGLFWVNVKRGPLMVRMTYPEGVKVLKRERLIVPKRT